MTYLKTVPYYDSWHNYNFKIKQLPKPEKWSFPQFNKKGMKIKNTNDNQLELL